jgi:hypothetical protein
MAGARIEFLDLSGRSLGATDLVLSGNAAVARLPAKGAGVLLWHGLRDGRAIASGILLP